MDATLVTGGCGFIGRHLVGSIIANQEHRVDLVDDLSSGSHPSRWLNAELVDEVRPDFLVYKTPAGTSVNFHHGNLLDILPRLSGAYREIYHLAATVGGRLALEHRPFEVAQNLAVDAAFFRWISRNHDHSSRVLYMSSSAAYPLHLQKLQQRRPLVETDVDAHSSNATDGVYGWCKLTGEYLARVAARKHGVHIACVRPFSGYGPGQDLTYPIPAIAGRVVARHNPVAVWGPGTQARDFIYVSDCIVGMRRALDHVQDGSAVNLGTGRATTMAEAAQILGRLAGYDPDISNDSSKPTGAEFRVADPTKMVSTLRWSPSVGLEEGLRRVLDAAGAS